MTTLAERALEARLSTRHRNRSSFARDVGVTPQAVQLIEEGTTRSLKGDTLTAYARVTGYSIEWLQSGRGPKFPKSRDIGTVSASETAGDYVRVEQIGEADMGDGWINEDGPEVIRSVDFAPPYIRSLLGFVPTPGRLKLVTGRGDSMVPTIQPGDVVLVDTGCATFDGDGLYLVNSGHGQQIKRLQDRGGTIYVVSDNIAYTPQPANERTIIGGKVYLRNRLDRMA